MKRKLLIIFGLLLVATVALCGCSPSGDKSGAESASASSLSSSASSAVSSVSDDDCFVFTPSGNGYSVVARYYDMPRRVVIPDTYEGKPVIGIGQFTVSTEDDSVNRSVEEIVIPSSVKSIGAYAFMYYESLKTIVIPEGVTTLSTMTFEGCRSLTSITIPVSVRYIMREVFYGCYQLKSINYQGTKEQWGNISKATAGYEDLAWDAGTGNYTIHCTDGDIQKS